MLIGLLVGMLLLVLSSCVSLGLVLCMVVVMLDWNVLLCFSVVVSGVVLVFVCCLGVKCCICIRLVGICV